MTKEQITQAKILRCRGLTYKQIGEHLACVISTVYRALNPKVRQQGVKYSAEYYKQNKERILAQQAEYYQQNKERIAEYYQQNKERIAEYYQQNKEQIIKRIVEYHRNRYQNDVQYRLAHKLRKRLRGALKNKQKTGSAVRDLGCSVDEALVHLERQFHPGMTWENQGEWHIDHIIPLSHFDLEDRGQLLMACHYTNLQPLWAADNLSKGATCPID